MKDNKALTPVYLCTGLLDSGKTSFIKETLMEQDWIEAGVTLLIQCEEGEYELEEEYLRRKKIRRVTAEEPETVTPEWLTGLDKEYKPAQVIIEFNGMWNLQEFLQLDFPKQWGLAGIYSTVDGQTLDQVMTNMRNLFMNQLIESDLIVINRCDRNMKRVQFRKAIKLQNPGAQLIFEALDGSIINFSEEDLPYDLKQQSIVLDDSDYGTWYADAFENPDRYVGKEFEFLAQLFRPIGMPKNMFVPGRLVMACCAADVRFYGFPCKSDTAFRFAQKSWARVKVKMEWQNRRGSDGREERLPVLRLISQTPAEAPKDEVVTL